MAYELPRAAVSATAATVYMLSALALLRTRILCNGMAACAAYSTQKYGTGASDVIGNQPGIAWILWNSLDANYPGGRFQ